MRGRYSGILAMILVAGGSSPSHAEYLIYLKGGHYIAADNCTYLGHQDRVDEGDAEKEEAVVVQVEDCAKGKPEGRLFWSTLDGKFGEVNADDVYYILGSKALAPIAPHRQAKALEDYLIVNRGESFINAKAVSEGDGRVYALKRDVLANINRRDIAVIVPEADVKIRSGDGLCPGERAEFGVAREPRISGGHFVGVFKNLAKEACMEATFEVQIYEQGAFKGNFEVTTRGSVRPGSIKRFDVKVPADYQDLIAKSLNREAGIQLCYTKVQSLAHCEVESRQQSR